MRVNLDFYQLTIGFYNNVKVNIQNVIFVFIIFYLKYKTAE